MEQTSEPDFYLGMSEGQPPHWGGPKRKVFIVDRPRFRKTGRHAWRVRVVPPIPERERSGLTVPDWVLTERYVDETIESLGATEWITVNIWRYEDPAARQKDSFDDVDLSLEYVGEVALDSARLPDAPDYAKEWEREFARIRRFVETHGHSRVPEPYHDEQGRLDILVGNLRRQHSGRAWLGEGPAPKEASLLPGVDAAADLNRLEGWSWEIEDAQEVTELRSNRLRAPLVREMGLPPEIEEIDYIRAVTLALQSSKAPAWRRLRQLVRDEGLDPARTVLADLFSTRRNEGYLGLLVTPQQRLFRFYLGFSGESDDPDRWTSMKLAEWRELRNAEDQQPYADQIRLALVLLRE